MPAVTRQMNFNGLALVLASDVQGVERGDVVRYTQVGTNLFFKVDISETNAGPKWVANPGTQIVSFGQDFDHAPFTAYLESYQILTIIKHGEGVNCEDTLSQFDTGGRAMLDGGQSTAGSLLL